MNKHMEDGGGSRSHKLVWGQAKMHVPNCEGISLPISLPSLQAAVLGKQSWGKNQEFPEP